MADNEQNKSNAYYVSQKEPEAKPPPVLETGALKWIRENLFNSITNAILTIVGIFVIYYSIRGLTIWTIRDANWFSVSANFRNFMLGRYESEFEWRAILIFRIALFFMGSAIAVWMRQVRQTMLVSIVVIILTLQILPRTVDSSIQLPSWYAGAGNTEITVAQTTEVAFDNIGFIGREGEEISIRFAMEDISSDQALADVNGFLDNIANMLRNQAINRLENIETLARYQELVDAHDATGANDVPVLTQAQYENYSAEIESTEIIDPIIESFALNNIPILVEIIDPETMEALGSVVLTTPEDILEVTLPADGWYILRKVVADEGSEGLSLLDVRGIYPSAKRESNTSLAFTRRPDGFSIENVEAPVFDGEEVAFVDIIRNQYRGDRPLNDYLRTYVSPFFRNLAQGTTIALLAGLAGYVVAELLRNSVSMSAASSFATYGLVSIPALLWVLVNGMYLYTVMMWLLFAAMCVVCYLLFKMAQRNGFSPGLAIVGAITYLIIVGTMLQAHGFPLSGFPGSFGNALNDLMRLLTFLPLVIDDAAVARFLIWLGIIFIPASIYMGKNLHIPGEEVKFNPIIMVVMAVVMYLIATIALLGNPASINMDWLVQFLQIDGLENGKVTADTFWALHPSDSRNWTGMLLTMMLTVYGIIAAFPIGIALALGRRSDLPLIKYLCTAYIELVRGSPFITVLFFMQLFIPLINPEFSEIPGSYRAIVATIAFSAAYLAENVRGGLQSLPPGQEEAAKALGLNPWQTITLITLPQALKAVIPALVGQFIGLYKDTTLVVIVGLIDLVGFVGAMVVQAEFLGTRLEGLLFISILYFVVSYIMSYVSRLLEASGAGGTRRM